jgi:hypothetical protein
LSFNGSLYGARKAPTRLGLSRPQDPAGEVLGGGIAAAEDRAHPAARAKRSRFNIGQEMHPPRDSRNRAALGGMARVEACGRAMALSHW